MKSSKVSVIKSYFETAQAVSRNKKIYLPFIIFAGIEFIGLALIYFFPRQPLVPLFGPPIKTFWGNRFLHYPYFFLLLPKLASLYRMFLSVIVGSFTTGCAVAFLYKRTAKDVLKKYISLFLIVLLITVLFYLANRATTWILLKYFSAGHAKLLFIGPRWWLGPISTVANFCIALVIQALFIYSIPALMCDAKLLTALAQSVVFMFKNIVMSLLLVGLPMLIYVPIIILNSNATFLMDTLFPEVMFWIALTSTIASSLIIDPLVTISTALLYQSRKNQ